ncbi:hypothetical protein UPYG_G00242270 [Umbra pygmaea]|uniref:Ig-like domain-containing protein n=1 Tax=Umbra pygmaea TaxID=75934 RepID=A0ABD0WFL7_UMBPY
MKNLLVFLLLSSFWSLCSWGINGTALLVTQSDDVTVTEGGTAQIQCCWNRTVTRVSINWWKVNSSSYNKTLLVNNSQCQNNESTQTVVCCSNWTISTLNISDSGRYICKVSIEIPGLLQSVGNGTRVTVTKIEGGQPASADQLTSTKVLLGVLLPLLLIALIYLYTLRRNQGGQGAARVIHQTTDLGDTELQMEELEEAGDQSSNSSSRGSTQWCQVQVYESFDYLALPNKEKG